MVLHPLEFSDCFLDPPWFRSSIKQHEDELEKTNNQIKLLIKDAKAMLLSCKKQCEAMHTFSDRLQNFEFEIIGDNLTDAERGIAGSLKEFGTLLEEIKDEWSRTIERSELQLIEPLEKFRKDHIHSYRESKKTFDKSSERYYKQMEQTLGLSHKKKDQLLRDSDEELIIQKKNFHRHSLDYVCKLQEVQERKKFEFVEHLLMFMQVYFNFFHQTHETANDCKEYMNDIQLRLVNTRSQYEGTRDKVQSLMQKMMDDPSPDVPNASKDSPQHAAAGRRWARAGYLHLLEKNPLGSRFTTKWTRFFATYTKENKLFQMMPAFGLPSASSSTVAKIGQSHLPTVTDPLIVKSCTRRASDSIDKRFCFDIEVENPVSGKQSLLTLQACSDGDRKKWIASMDGREPNYVLTNEYKKPEKFVLNDRSIAFVECVIKEIERRGVDSEGIYRLVGVSSKVDKLLQLVMDDRARNQVNYQDDEEWEMNTLTSALKNFFRNLPEPIMTFDLHDDLILAAKQEEPGERLKRVLSLTSKLSSESRKVLSLLIEHLVKVASQSSINKMTVQNLGVCFGPTLMRPKQETVQSIMEIKFNNIIVEILIENYDVIFVHGTWEAVEKNLMQNRPVVDSRPSIRMRTRPGRRLTRRPSTSDDSSHGIHSDDSSPKFQRGHAIRAVPKRQGSPWRNRSSAVSRNAIRKSNDTAADDVSDELGRISPLDLDLDVQFPVGRSVDSYRNVQQTSSLRETQSKESSFRKHIRTVHSNSARHLSPKASDEPKSNADSSNENHNNSTESLHTANEVASVQERKKMLLQASTRNNPPAVKPKTSIIKRISPLQNSKPKMFLVKTLPTSSLLKGSEHVDKSCCGHDDANMDTCNTNRPVMKPQEPKNDSHQHETVSAEFSYSTPENRIFVALYNCEAEHPSELSFEPGDVVYNVSESDEPGWLIGTLHGVIGLIPENYVREKLHD